MIDKGKLFLQAYEGKIETIKAALKNDSILVTAVDESERTLIHWAALGGHNELVQFLLESGSPVNPTDDNDMTPLLLASSAGRFEIVRMLVSRGADVNAQSQQGHSPLQYAASKGWKEIAQLLIENGANVNISDARGARPLHRAASIGIVPIVLMLVECQDIDVNPRDKEGNTPLHLACEENRGEVCKILVSNGAELDCKNKEQKTPLDLAAPKLAEMLRNLPSSE